MPRRANATSYGGKQGNTPNPDRHAGPGPLTASFKGRMKVLAERAARAKRWERLLADTNPDDDAFFKAFDRVADRSEGKPAQALDLTSGGEKLLPATEREARLLAIFEAAAQRAKK